MTNSLKAKPKSSRNRALALTRGPAWLGSLMLLAGCTPVGLLNSLDRLTPSGERAERVARAVSFGPDERLRLDVWRPAGQRATGARLPVVIFFYGGNWASGSRSDYGFAGAAFAAQGFIAIVPDYRLVPQVRFPAFVEDGALAVKWARDHAAQLGGDPNRITLAGHSAGAYNAAMLSLDRRYLAAVGVPAGTVKAAALLAGPYDWAPFTDAASRNALGHWPRPAETQPINFVGKAAPPMLLATGADDRVVWPRNSRHLHQRLRAAGVASTLKIYPRVSHTDIIASLSRPFRAKSPALADSAAFLRDYSAN